MARTFLLILSGALFVFAAHAQGDTAWRIYTSEPGLHRVTFEELASAGETITELDPDALSLDNRGRLVPLAVEDGGDGRFGPGDWLEFAAEILPGEHTFYHPHARHNVYWLRERKGSARRLDRRSTIEQSALASAQPIQARRKQHLERDQLLIRLRSNDIPAGSEPELWYWAKVTHRNKEPFVLDLDLRDALPDEPTALRVGLRGISSLPVDAPAPRPADHQIKVSSGGRLIANSSWSGREPTVVGRRQVVWPASDTPERRQLEFEVPKRKHGDDPLIDVIMIDWAEVTYAHNGRLTQDQVELHVLPQDQGGILELHSAPGERLIIAGSATGYLELTVPADGTVRAPLGREDGSVWVRRAGSSRRATLIEVDRPSSLATNARQADYLVISHASLIEAAREIEDLHEELGLTVDLIDVQDVYDEFNHGVISPTAIRDFLSHALLNWQRPRPRFVLLVGDASWDTKNATVDDANYSNWVGRQLLSGERFAAKETADYNPDLLNDRNLIPSWNYHTHEGHAASDAFYTLLEGDDELPDIALGRFPVASPDEVTAIVAKTRRYVESAPLGPWRARNLWISGAQASHQRRTLDLAAAAGASGRTGTVVLPGAEATAADRDRILDSLDEGNLVTHFIGHGGRFIWRTGTPDLANQVDLFGLEDLERLAKSPALPVVLSVACYSAPFDHPSADSIGEAFLRLEDRGAVAFIGASWRNAPPPILSTLLVNELTSGGTIGEALMRTKRQLTSSDAIHLFNLLGDPAVVVKSPQRSLDVRHRLANGELEVVIDVPPDGIGGRVALDFLGITGESLGTVELAAPESPLTVRRPFNPDYSSVTAYFWNEATGVDGLGVTHIEPAVAVGSTP